MSSLPAANTSVRHGRVRLPTRSRGSDGGELSTTTISISAAAAWLARAQAPRWESASETRIRFGRIAGSRRPSLRDEDAAASSRMLFAASALTVAGFPSDLSAARVVWSIQLLESPSKRSRLHHARPADHAADTPFTLWTPRSDGTALRGKPISMLNDENRAPHCEVRPSAAPLSPPSPILLTRPGLRVQTSNNSVYGRRLTRCAASCPAQEVLVLDDDDVRAPSPSPKGGVRSPPWSPTRVLNLEPLTPSRSPLHGGRSPWEPLPDLLSRNSAGSPQPQHSVERSSAERRVKDLRTAVDSDSAAARTPSPVRQLLELAQSTAAHPAAAFTHQPQPTSHVRQQSRPLPRTTGKPQLPAVVKPSGAVLGRRPRQAPARTNNTYTNHASAVPPDEPKPSTRRTSTRPSLAAARASTSLRSRAPEQPREKAAEKAHTTPRSHDRRPSPLELPGSILTPPPVTSTTTTAALLKSPAPPPPLLPRLPDPPRQGLAGAVKQTTSALRLLKKNKRNCAVLQPLQPLPEPATAAARRAHAALERADSGPPTTLEPLSAVVQEQAEPHPFTSAPFPAVDNPASTSSGGDEDEGSGGGAAHGMKARLNKLKKRSSSIHGSALQLQKLVPSHAAAAAGAVVVGAATGAETERAFGDAEADGASEVICPGVQRRKMPRGFDRPLSPPHPQQQQQQQQAPASRPLSRVSRPSSQSAPRAAALSVEQQQLLQQRQAEVELLLRLDVASAPARAIASHQVKQLDTFLQTLHELARCAAMEPQAVHSHLCQQDVGRGAMDSSMRRQSGMDWMAMAATDAALKRAVSHSKTLPKEAQVLSPEELLKTLATGAQLLRETVAIKVQDNNDLRTAHKAVQDALQFFSLAALSDACSV